MKKSVNLTPRITTLLEELATKILPCFEIGTGPTNAPHRLLEPYRDQEPPLPLELKFQLVDLAFEALMAAAQEGDAIEVGTLGRTLCDLAVATHNVWPTAERVLTLMETLEDDLTEEVVEQLDFLYRLHRGSAGPGRPPVGFCLHNALRNLADTPAS